MGNNFGTAELAGFEVLKAAVDTPSPIGVQKFTERFWPEDSRGLSQASDLFRFFPTASAVNHQYQPMAPRESSSLRHKNLTQLPISGGPDKLGRRWDLRVCRNLRGFENFSKTGAPWGNRPHYRQRTTVPVAKIERTLRGWGLSATNNRRIDQARVCKPLAKLAA